MKSEFSIHIQLVNREKEEESAYMDVKHLFLKNAKIKVPGKGIAKI